MLTAIPEPNPENRLKIREIPIRGEVPSAAEIPSGCRFHPRCPYAKDICVKNEPPLIEVEPDHYVACWRCSKR